MTAKLAIVLRYSPAYVACVLGAGLLWQRPWLLLALYVGLSVALLLRWHTRADLYFFFLPCLLGPAGEGFAVYMGAWTYADPGRPLPPWLPLGWGISMLFLWRVSRALALEGSGSRQVQKKRSPG